MMLVLDVHKPDTQMGLLEPHTDDSKYKEKGAKLSLKKDRDMRE